MISPQSIAVASAAGNLVGKESDLFRFTAKHSFIMLMLICVIVLCQAYLFKWIVPVYQTVVTKSTTEVPDYFAGVISLLILALLLTAFVFMVKILNRKKVMLS